MVVAVTLSRGRLARRLLSAPVRASSRLMKREKLANLVRLLAAASVALCFAALAGCSKAPQPLRVGTDTWPAYQLLGLAQEKGFFRQEGANVQLLEFGSLSDTRRAYETGKLDGLAITVVEVLMARDTDGRSPKIVRVLDFSDGADVVLARKEIHSVRDLRGKRVGVELASLGVYMLGRALALEGLDLADIVPVSKDPVLMHEELFSGELDAAVTYPPESEAILADPRFHAIFSSRQIPGEIVDVIAFDESVLRERPDEVRAFQRGIDRAFEFLRSEPEEAYRVMAERYATTPEKVKASLEDGIKLVGPEEQPAYFGERGRLRASVDGIAATLRAVHLLRDKPGVTDCIAKP